MNIHLFETGKRAAAHNMALDEALLDMHAAGRIPPVLRVYGWDPPALTIGYAQDWAGAVDHAACARLGVPVVRRSTGGGAVLHEHEVTYSLVAPASRLGNNVLDSFREVSRALIAALAALGLDAEFAPLNDITLHGKKISGNAQVRRHGAVLQHGTILLGLDRDKMFSLLKVSEEKLRRKQITHAQDRVTCAQEQLGHAVSFDEAAHAVIHGFTQWAGADLRPFEPPPELHEKATHIEQEKFGNIQWNEFRVIADGGHYQ